MSNDFTGQHSSPGTPRIGLHALVRCVCGSTMFRRCYRTGGWWKQLVESKPGGSVEVIESDLDSVRCRREPKTMECAGCGKRVPNPDYKAPNDQSSESCAK